MYQGVHTHIYIYVHTSIYIYMYIYIYIFCITYMLCTISSALYYVPHIIQYGSDYNTGASICFPHSRSSISGQPLACIGVICGLQAFQAISAPQQNPTHDSRSWRAFRIVALRRCHCADRQNCYTLRVVDVQFGLRGFTANGA